MELIMENSDKILLKSSIEDILLNMNVTYDEGSELLTLHNVENTVEDIIKIFDMNYMVIDKKAILKVREGDK